MVAGIGVVGFAAADALLERGARVVVVDGRRRTGPARARRRSCEILGARCGSAPDGRRAAGCRRRAPTSSSPRPAGARTTRCSPRRPRAGVPVWSEVELAWRMRPATGAAPWLDGHRHQRQDDDRDDARGDARAAGLRAVAAGNVGHAGARGRARTPSRTTCWPSSCRASSCTRRRRCRRWPAPASTSRPTTSTGTAARRPTPATRAGSTRTPRSPASTTSPTRAPSSSSATPTSSRAAAPSASPSGIPALSMLGVVDDVLADRAFVAQRRTSAAELATLDDVRAGAGGVLAPHLVANALAAAALARAARRAARRRPRRAARRSCPPAHRLARVAEGGGVDVGRRLEGDEPARRGRGAARLRARGLGRRRPGQGRRRFDDLVARARRPAARRGAARPRPRPRRARRSRDTPRMCPSSRSTSPRLER